MTNSYAVDKRRRDLHGDPNCEFVCSSRFQKLLISRCSLERSDEAEAFIHGLRNPTNGFRYLVETERLACEDARSPSEFA